MAFLSAQLGNLQDPATGKPLIRRVYRKEEVYQGPYLHLAPDMMFSWWEESGLEARKSVPGADHPSLRDNTTGDEMLSASWSGTHRLHGILAMKGGPLRRGEAISTAHITDIAPTLFYLLGIPVPAVMDGKVLLEAFQDEFAAAHPVQYNTASLPAYTESHAETAYTAEESEKIQERLKGLGYID
jgi:predicted AlkP superfamily phosphohydrolase/phosphomutase